MSRYDEHAQYDRPKRRTRPRTKERPVYENAVEATVLTVDRGRYTCRIGDSDRLVTAVKARPLACVAPSRGWRPALSHPRMEHKS